VSADNGIYILETLKGEYRVVHTQAIENYQWDAATNSETDDPDIHIINARKIWKGCSVFKTKEEARQEAESLYDEIMESDFPVLEYGINIVKIDREF